MDLINIFICIELVIGLVWMFMMLEPIGWENMMSHLQNGMILTVEPGIYISDRIPVPDGQPEY